jgi:hypothetical protein
MICHRTGEFSVELGEVPSDLLEPKAFDSGTGGAIFCKAEGKPHFFILGKRLIPGPAA